MEYGEYSHSSRLGRQPPLQMQFYKHDVYNNTVSTHVFQIADENENHCLFKISSDCMYNGSGSICIFPVP